jgi:hypothetical protein
MKSSEASEETAKQKVLQEVFNQWAEKLPMNMMSDNNMHSPTKIRKQKTIDDEALNL